MGAPSSHLSEVDAGDEIIRTFFAPHRGHLDQSVTNRGSFWGPVFFTQHLQTNTNIRLSIREISAGFDTEQPRPPHRVFVPQSRHHDDHPDVLLPHHPPEVGHGARQRPLGADEVSLRSSTLNTRTAGFSKGRENVRTADPTLTGTKFALM